MINMNQGDLFKLILELNFANYTAIAEAIRKVSGLELPYLPQSISRIVNNNKNGKPFRNILPDTMTEGQFAKQFFQIIFKDCDIINGANEHIAYEKFQKIKSYLSENQLTFNGLNTLEDSDNIKDFITTMIVEAFERHTCHVKSSTENPKVEIPTTIAASLHSQNIICPTQFFGRQDCLYKMRTMICSYKFVVLSGIGGIGKTYLSRRYAYEYSSYYKVKQIITYDKNLSSMKDVILSLKFDNLNDTNMNDSDKLEKRISLLNAMSEDTLLIIDNFDVKLSDMEYFDELRTNSNMHIIITTRLNDCFPPEQTININPMPIEDQLELFKFHYQEEITQEEIIKILNCIDGHTLLIELVAKSMHEGALLAPEMYAYLTGVSSETQLPPVSINKDSLTPYKKTMNDYIKLLFDMAHLNNKAKEALLYLSLLPIEGIECRLFYNLLPKYKETFNILINSSWAIRENNSIRLHPAIRDIVRKELKPSHKNCASVLSNIHTLLQTQNGKVPEHERQDVCKILHSISNIEDFYLGCDNITMLSFFAEFCFNSYDFSLALELYSTAAEIAEDAPIQTRTSLYLKIGDVYKRLANLNESINSYKKALESNKRLQSGHEKNLQDAEIYLLLSDIYRKDSQYTQAMSCNDTAIKIFENEQTGTNASLLAEIYNKRGIIFLNMAEAHENYQNRTNLLNEALNNYIEALNLRIQCNDSRQKLAYSYHNIGTAYNKIGRYDYAVEYHTKALKIREEEAEAQNIPKTDIASSHVWLGNDYMAMGNMKLAKEHFENSLQIRENILGKTHPEVAWSLMNLSDWYQKNNDITTALKLANRAYEIRIQNYAPTHNYVLKSKEQIDELQRTLTI